RSGRGGKIPAARSSRYDHRVDPRPFGDLGSTSTGQHAIRVFSVVGRVRSSRTRFGIASETCCARNEDDRLSYCLGHIRSSLAERQLAPRIGRSWFSNDLNCQRNPAWPQGCLLAHVVLRAILVFPEAEARRRFLLFHRVVRGPWRLA